MSSIIHIEIHGFTVFAHTKAEEVRQRILDLFAGDPDYDAMVVSQVASLVRNGFGATSSFLRVYSTCEEEGKHIENVLRMNDFEVQRTVILASHTEPAMWKEKEILEDLSQMRRGARICGTISEASLDLAIAALCRHKYEAVVGLYKALRDDLRLFLTDSVWRPTIGDMRTKANVAETSDDVQVRLRTRLIMIEQILASLDPDSAEAA